MRFLKRKFTLIWAFSALFALQISAQSKISKPDPSQQYQSIEGWGASLCWWAHMLGKIEDEKTIDWVVDMVTSPEQLNMNIFRYNIGGGDDPSHFSTPGNPGHMAKGKGVRAEMDGFLASADADYNWDADAGQRKVMLKLAAKRSDAVFEAFSNSPPYWMTYSGCAGGNDPATADNLKPEYYTQFADYLLEVVKHYKEVYGIEFKTLEPFNEPLTNYWGYLGSQEGCHFDVQSQIDFLRVIYPKLQATNLSTVLSASDETDLRGFIRTLEGYLATDDIKGMVGQVNTHTYAGSNEQRERVLELTEEMGKEFWQSESGPIGIPGGGLRSNLGMAQRMIDDLRYMKPSAWLDWQIIEMGTDTWGLMDGNWTNETVKVTKQFYVRMQITRFVKQGYTIIESNNDQVLTALSPKGNELVIVALNEAREEQAFTFDLSGFNKVKSAGEIYRTSRNEDCNTVKDAASLDGTTLSYVAPAMSLTTIVVPVK